MKKLALAFIAIAAAFVLGAPAHAQLDCSSMLGVRVCANPDLNALEQERQSLQAELAGLDASHAVLVQESAWLAAQEACPDDACLSAGYLDRNQSLRLALAAARQLDETEPLAELPTIEPPRLSDDGDAEDGPREINPDPPFRIQDYLGAIIMLPLAFLIAFWLLGKAARARRGE